MCFSLIRKILRGCLGLKHYDYYYDYYYYYYYEEV